MHLRQLATSQVGPPRLLPERHRVQAWSSAEAGLRTQAGLRVQAWSWAWWRMRAW
jgi:hypothetical protein